MPIASLNRFVQSALLIVGSLSSLCVHADSSQIFLEKDGYVLFESENASIAEGWVLNTDIPGSRGDGYLQWTGDNYFSKADAGNGTITYRIRIQVAGNYELRWRSRIATGDSNTESNDSWIRFPTAASVPGEYRLDGWTKVFIGQIGQWTWSSRTVDGVANRVRQYFEAGDHVVEISGRSTGHAIDRIALYRYEDVSFDDGLNGTLKLSPIIQADGSVVIPVEDDIVEPEPVDVGRVNVEPVSASDSLQSDGSCSANTAVLPLLSAATINLQDSASGYDADELVSEADQRGILLQFDLTQLPPITDAMLRYSIGNEPSDGILDVYLGSHNVWAQDERAVHPEPTVLLAEGQGGWNAASRYATSLEASLLSNAASTLMLISRTGADGLQLTHPPYKDADAVADAVADGALRPQLVVSGGTGFCDAWQTNLAAQIDQSEPVDTASINRKSKGGSIMQWSLWALLLLAMGRVTHRHWHEVQSHRGQGVTNNSVYNAPV